MKRELSEEPRAPKTDDRGLARDVAKQLQRAADYARAVADGEAQVSDLIVERMWDFSAFPIVGRYELERLTPRTREEAIEQ